MNTVTRFATIILVTSALACAGGEEEPDMPRSHLVDLLDEGAVVFGMFAGPFTEEQGELMGANRDLDFVFYSLERGPFDIPTMQTYMTGMATAAGEDTPRPVALRIPAIREGQDEARDHVTQGLGAGIGSVVFPHVESAEDAALAVETMGESGWPGNPNGSVVNMLIIEDRVGIENADAIVSTPGVSVAIPGPGDLRRAYEGDMEAVENAIQTVLTACKTHDVACGITAGPNDIEERIEQGFRVFILTNPDALSVGRAAAGR